MSGGKVLIDQITMTLKNVKAGDLLSVYVDVHDNSLSTKWLHALNNLIKNSYHLEKNYCFVGFTESDRNAGFICNQINKSIGAINAANLGYQIDDHFTVDNTIVPGKVGEGLPGGKLVHEKLNLLHRYFEDLQGQSGRMSEFYVKADPATRWHIRQLNLLCHEYESLVMSMRKIVHAPEWRRPSQLMCWLQAPRFNLDVEDYDLFGVESLNRPLGGVFVGVNKSVGKHHWEVFNDEGRDSRINELTTSTLISQVEAAGDFDIEWANDPGKYHWQQRKLAEFKEWLTINGFDPMDKSLTIGHPQVGQVNLEKSFGTNDYRKIWQALGTHLDVYSIATSDATVTYEYNWSDPGYMDLQIKSL